MIYFIQYNDKIKIGISRKPYGRMKNMQTGNPEALKMLLIVPGGHELELGLHKRFVDHHIRGEWFKVNPELTAYIDSNLILFPLPEKPKDKRKLVKAIVRNQASKLVNPLNGKKGWVEWTKRGIKTFKRYPRSRHWLWEDGKWVKSRAIYRPDLGNKTEDEYVKFKADEKRRKRIKRNRNK